MSAIIWGQSPFFADIALFYHAMCKLHCAPKSQCEKKFNYFYIQTPSFCVFSSVKKTGYDVIKLGNEDLPPSSGLS